MDDVVRNVREEFLNEGVDLEILEDLRRVCMIEYIICSSDR